MKRKRPAGRTSSGGRSRGENQVNQTPSAKTTRRNGDAPHPRRPRPALRELEGRILKALAERPLDKVELSKALGLPPSFRAKLRELLGRLEVDGKIARIRKDRYIIPQEADLFTGTIQFHASGAAHVLSERKGEPDLFISGENTFTAMHGDRVVARIARAPESPEPGRPARREGRVIRILQRASETIVGTLQKSKMFHYVVADDPRFVHNLYVPAPIPPLMANIGDKVVAKLDAWPSRHVNPEGHIIEVLGPVSKPGVDMLSIIRKHRLPTEFPPDVVREASSVSPEVEPAEAARREDHRDEFIITIDPDDARDFDDAIHVERLPGGGWRVGIHIADVSHYVRPKSALDREALSRGNSVYLADRVIPMLPEALSNGICSLKPAVERLAFSVFAEITAQGKVRSARFAKSVIRSAARLTYREAFAILKRPPGTDPVAQRVHTAWELASVLRKKRFAGGSLDLDFPEIKVWLDANGRPERLERVENDISHQLIEELMLLANELVGRELKIRRQPAVYRIHEDPDPDKLAEFREFAASQGVRAGDLTHRPELQKLLVGIRGKPHESAVKIALLKSLKRARYAPDPLGHYGLAKADYTHFTSPIRRYSDLIVHRSLERLLGLTRHGPDSSTLAATADHISATERVAAEAERESVRLKKLEYFQAQVAKRTGQSFRAQIIDVRNYGIFVELPEFLLTGLVHVSSLDDDFFVLDPGRQRLVGRRTRRTYQTGDEIDVIVARVDMFKQQVDFKIV
ncbi:MAG: ribonuclease R [Terrimicrobiaceae bacterium]|nr:ribonuclease R [Terrimicrobiaceae bacterium]